MSLEGCTLYCSAEPCVLCSGAIKWCGVSRVVFSVSQEMLQRITGGRRKLACAALVNTGCRSIEVVGPMIAEEGVEVFAGFAFTPRATRHAAAMVRKSCQPMGNVDEG